jgi:hypothetical protein
MNEIDVDTHLHFLLSSAEEYASATSRSKYYERFLKSIESKFFLEATGTIDQRKSIARINPEYLEAVEEAKNADYDYALLYAKRESAKLAISLYQSKLKVEGENKY